MGHCASLSNINFATKYLPLAKNKTGYQQDEQAAVAAAGMHMCFQVFNGGQ